MKGKLNLDLYLKYFQQMYRLYFKYKLTCTKVENVSRSILQPPEDKTSDNAWPRGI